MGCPVGNFWDIRLSILKTALEENNFNVCLAKDPHHAGSILLETMMPELRARTVSWGGSVTVTATGLLDRFKSRSDLDVIDAFEKGISLEESWERRRRAFSVDLYLTGTNAVTETGHLVNLDRTGNRVAALAFGPRSVVVFAGRNKIVPRLEEAFARVKSHAAPINAMRLKYKTPCTKTAVCQECNTPDRLCNTWAITEKSFPKGRITLILINQDLGF